MPRCSAAPFSFRACQTYNPLLPGLLQYGTTESPCLARAFNLSDTASLPPMQSVTSGKAGGLIGEPLKAVIVSRSKRHHLSIRYSLTCLCSYSHTALKGRHSHSPGRKPWVRQPQPQALKGRHSLCRPFRARFKSLRNTQGLRPGLSLCRPCGAGFPDSTQIIH